MNPINTLFAWPIALSLYGATAWGRAVGGALSTGPQRVDGEQATRDYARANGLDTRSPARDRAEWQLAMGPDYWRGRG